MARATIAELQARIDELEARNATLEREAGTQPTVELPVEPPAPRGRSRWWTLLASVLAVLGLVLAPVSVVLGYAKTQLSDTQGFVETFAPLAESPEVQQAVTGAAVVAITEAVDIPALTSEVFGGLEEIGLPSSATAALRLLEGPAAQGIESLIASTVAQVVESDAFAVVWREALQLSHAQLVATLSGDTGALVTISDADVVEVQLGPVIEVVQTRLVESGIGFAAAIPAMDVSIEIAQADGIGQLRLAYAAALTLGFWLPWISLALILAAVVVARRRRVAAITVFTVLAVLMAVMAVTLAIVRTVVTTAATGVTSSALGIIYDAAVESMLGTVTAVAVIAIAVALVVWFAGPSRLATGARSIGQGAVGAGRKLAVAQGMNTGRVGVWIDRHHTLLLVLLAVAAAAVILVVRPLSAGTVVVTVLVALLVLVALEFVRRPDTAPVVDATAPAPVS